MTDDIFGHPNPTFLSRDTVIRDQRKRLMTPPGDRGCYASPRPPDHEERIKAHTERVQRELAANPEPRQNRWLGLNI